MSKQSAYKDDMVRFGEQMPKVYIDKITLSGREDEGDEYMGLEVELSIKDSADGSSNYLLIDNQELWKILNIEIFVATNPRAQDIIDGNIRVGDLSLAPYWPNSFKSNGDLNPLYENVLNGDYDDVYDYWKVRMPYGVPDTARAGNNRGEDAWIKPETLKVAYRRFSLENAIANLLGADDISSGLSGVSTVSERLIRALQETPESDANSSRMIKILNGSSFTFRMSIHKNFLSAERAAALMPSAPDINITNVFSEGGSSHSAVRNADIFPNDLYVFAYTAFKRNEPYWALTGVTDEDGGLSDGDVVKLPALFNEFTGEVAYEHVIRNGKIKFREYKFFTADDKLYHGDVILNAEGDYIASLNYDNERIANEIGDRVLSLINTERETDVQALNYYSLVVSNLLGFAESPEMFLKLYRLLPQMPNRMTTTAAGRFASAYSDLMEQLRSIFSTAEVLHKKMVRNPKYFDKRVRGSFEGCAPVGYFHYPEGCVAPDGAPTPHSQIWLAGELPPFKETTASMTGKLEASGGTDLDFILEEDPGRLAEWFKKKRINGYFLLNLENMMHRREYYPGDRNFVLIKKLLHHFGFDFVKTFFYIDRVKINRAARRVNLTDGDMTSKISGTEEKVLTAQISRPQPVAHMREDIHGSSAGEVTTWSTTLAPTIISPTLLGYSMVGDATEDGTTEYTNSNWTGTKNASEQAGLHHRRDLFSPFGEGIPLVSGYPQGPGHEGTGLFFDVAFLNLPNQVSKKGRVILCYFSEPVCGMFGVEDASIDGLKVDSTIYRKIGLRYTADYSVINNTGGMCQLIYEQMYVALNAFQAYERFAEKQCSFDNRTGKFNEHFADAFHHHLINRDTTGEDLSDAFYVKAVAAYVILNDIVTNNYGGNADIMREETLNLVQSIDPKSGTIYQVREFSEKFENLLQVWFENFRGTYNESTEKWSWHKNYDPRLNPMSRLEDIVDPAHYGYSRPYGIHHEGMSLPDGSINLDETFETFEEVMEALDIEQYAKAAQMMRRDLQEKCGSEKTEIVNFVRRYVEAAANEYHDDGSRNLEIIESYSYAENRMAAIDRRNHPSVVSNNVSTRPPANHGYKMDGNDQQNFFLDFLDAYKTNDTPLKEVRFVGTPGAFGAHRGAWEMFMERTFDGSSANISAGVETLYNGQTPMNESNDVAYDYQVLRERIRLGLATHVNQIMSSALSCSGESIDDFVEKYLGGEWYFGCLNGPYASVSSQPTWAREGGPSATESPWNGWGLINASLRDEIINMIEHIEKLRHMGFWPYFDTSLMSAVEVTADGIRNLYEGEEPGTSPESENQGDDIITLPTFRDEMRDVQLQEIPIVTVETPDGEPSEEGPTPDPDTGLYD